MARIKVVTPKGASVHQIAAGRTALGSSEGCGLKVAGLPARLCALEHEGASLSFEAMAKGLLHNGKPSSGGALRAGDTLALGDVTIIVEEVSPSDKRSATVHLGERDKPPVDEKTVLLDTSSAKTIVDKAPNSPVAGDEKTVLLDTASAKTIVDKAPTAPAGGDDATIHYDTTSTEPATVQVGPTPPPKKGGKKDLSGELADSYKKIIEREVRKSDDSKTITDDRRSTLLQVMKNLGVKDETTHSMAFDLATREDGFTTAEILANLGVLTEDDIDVKPTKQLAGTRPQIEGKVLGEYKLVKELGAGGFGVVYKAESLVDGQIYAIKVLFKEYSDDITQLAIFARESKTAKQFDHPGILKVHGLDKFRNTYYMVTEFVDGGDLSDMIHKKGKIEWKEAATISSKICAAMEYATNPPGNIRGIIHRDIKPQNILMTKAGQPKVADFGLAKFEDGTTETQVYETTDAMIFKGTVSYAAPERFQGNKDIDHRSDIYSLGIMFYEMVTGRLPFSGKNVSELILAHINEKPVPPRLYAPDLPVAFENIILRCMMKKPEQRYNSAGELMKEFDDLLVSPEKTMAFSVTAALNSFKMLGNVAIPDVLPDSLPFRVRLKYILLRPRPRFYKITGGIAAAVILGIAALVLIPMLMEYRNVSKAGNLLAAFQYEEAIAILSSVVESNPSNTEAMDTLTNAKRSFGRLKSTLEPAIAKEKARENPDIEKLHTLASEAYDLNPMDREIATVFVDSAVGTAMNRLGRAEFAAAGELFRTATEKLRRSRTPFAREMLADLSTKQKQADPETMRQIYESLTDRSRLVVAVLSEQDGIAVEVEGKRQVPLAVLEGLYDKLTELLEVYRQMLEISPASLEARMGENSLRRLHSSFERCVELEKSGVDVRLQRLLSLLRVEQDIADRSLHSLKVVLDVWKAQTPFEQILTTASNFADPSDAEKTGIAIQLVQIVLNIDSGEERALALLGEIEAKLVTAFEPAHPGLALLENCRIALMTGLNYKQQDSGANAGKLTAKLATSMQGPNGKQMIHKLWPVYESLRIAFLNDAGYKAAGIPDPAAVFENTLARRISELAAEARFSPALDLVDLAMVQTGNDAAVPALETALVKGTGGALGKNLAGAISFFATAVDRAESYEKPFAAAFKAGAAKAAAMKGDLARLPDALKTIDDDASNEEQLRAVVVLLTRMKDSGLAWEQIDGHIAAAQTRLAYFDAFRKVAADRVRLFEMLASGAFDTALPLCSEMVSLLPKGKEGSLGTVHKALSEYIASLEGEVAVAMGHVTAADAAHKSFTPAVATEAPGWSKLGEAIAARRKVLDELVAKLATDEAARQQAMAMLAEADKLFADGKFAEALQKYTQSKTTFPLPGIDDKIAACNEMVNYRSIIERGKAALDAGDYQTALELFNSAREKKDTSEVRDLISRVNRLIVFTRSLAAGKTAMDAGDWVTAEREFSIALANAPDDRKAELTGYLNFVKVRRLVMEGDTALDRKDYRTARDKYDAAVKITDDAEARAGLAVSILEVTGLQDAKEEELIDRTTGESIFRKAFENFERYRQLTADDTETAKKAAAKWDSRVIASEALAWYYMWRFEGRRSDLERGLKVTDEGMKKYPGNTEIIEARCAILVWIGRADEALKLLLVEVEKRPSNYLLRRHLAGAYLVTGKTDDAEREYKKAIELNSGDALSYLGLGNIHKAYGRLAEAEAVILKAIEAAPLMPEAHNNLAWLYATAEDERFKKPLQALEHAEIANRITGYRNPDWLDTLAHAYAANGRYKSAVEFSEKSVELAPDRQDLKDHLAKFKDLLKEKGGN